MANGTEDGQVTAPAEPEFILTEEGALTPEQFAVREQAGTAAPEIEEAELLALSSEEAKRQTADAPLQTFTESFVSGATFGLIKPGTSTEEARVERQRRAEVSPTAALVGEVAGVLVPSLLSGGAGAAGAVARLTPVGRLAAATGRLASRGGLRRQVAAGAIEGMAQSAGDYVSRVALDEDAEFSGEALIGAALKGATLGGAVGGAAGVAARGIGRLGRKLEAAPVAKLDEAATKIAKKAKKATLSDDLETIAGGKSSTKWKRYKSVVGRKLKSDQAEPLRELGSRIDSLGASGARKKIDDLAERALATGDEEILGLLKSSRAAAEALEESASSTGKAWRQYADEVGLAKAKKRLTRDATPQTEDDLIANIALSDELAVKFNRQADELAARLGSTPPVVQVADEPARKLSERLVSGAKSTVGAARRGTEVATSALGAAELARGAGVEVPGVPSVRDIPGVGNLLGYYLQYKGARAAARGIGLIPASKASNAAAKVSSSADRIKAVVKGAVSKGARRVAASPRTVITPAAVAARIAEFGDVTKEDVAANVSIALDGTTSSVQASAAQTAARAVEYLKETLPSDPMPVRPPFMPPWQPSKQQTMDASRRMSAVDDPEGALEVVLSSPMSSLELEALNRVYPAMLARARQEIQEQADQMREDLPFDQLRAIGRRLGIPLTVESAVPGYGMVSADMSAQPAQPTPMFASPSTPGASPSASLEEIEPRR